MYAFHVCTEISQAAVEKLESMWFTSVQRRFFGGAWLKLDVKAANGALTHIHSELMMKCKFVQSAAGYSHTQETNVSQHCESKALMLLIFGVWVCLLLAHRDRIEKQYDASCSKMKLNSTHIHPPAKSFWCFCNERRKFCKPNCYTKSIFGFGAFWWRHSRINCVFLSQTKSLIWLLNKKNTRSKNTNTI